MNIRIQRRDTSIPVSNHRRRWWFLAVLTVLVSYPSAWAVQPEGEELLQRLQGSVVAVRVQKQVAGSGTAEGGMRQVLLNGVLVDSRIRPSIIKVVQSNGIAFDNGRRVVSYVGYKWMALDPYEPGVSVVLMQPNGRIADGKLLGIDQRNGIAVIQASRELDLVPRPRIRSSEIGPCSDCVRVNVNDRQMFSEAPVQRGESGGMSYFHLPERADADQGDLLFTPDGRFWGFVTGRDIDSQDDAPMEVKPAADVLGSVNTIISTGRDLEAGWIGVYIEDALTSAGATQVMVRSVVPGGPAEQAGIRQGDRLLGLQGEPIRGVRDFSKRIQWSDVGSQLNVQIRQGNLNRTIPIRVASRRDAPAVPNVAPIYLQISPSQADSPFPQIVFSEVHTIGVLANTMGPQLGIVGDDLTPQLGEFFGVQGGRGVLVVSMERGSLSERNGMRVGDVIVGLNQDPVTNRMEFARLLAVHHQAREWNIRLIRDRQPLDLKIVLPKRPE